MRTRTIVSIIILIAIIVAVWWLLGNAGSSSVTGSPQQVGAATFACSDGKNISAIFYESSSTEPAAITPGEPPVPTGSAVLSLSDGRTVTLKQTISASGARYANDDESMVFWNKGNEATVTEGATPSYTCIVVVPDPGGLPEVFEDGQAGFSLRYPSGWTVDKSYVYTALGEDHAIYGVKFTIPASLAEGTNLSDDSYLSVEQIPQTQECTADLFLAPGTEATTLEESGATYSFASTTGAAAGNRYEESVFALPGTNPCKAVRYLIHYGVFENYPAGSIERFDEDALIAKFDAIRHSLMIAQ